MIDTRSYIICLFVLSLSVLSVGLGRAEAPEFYPKETLVISTKTGNLELTVEVAATDLQQAHGLMMRKSLPAKTGLLLDIGKSIPVSMWMKDTLIPLDIVFIGSDGRILGISTEATPHSLKPISSMVPVRAVLELNGGESGRLNIQVGDKALHRIFSN